MKKIKKVLKKIDKNIIIIFLCVTVMLSQLFTHGIIDGHDIYVHMYRVVGMAQNISSGNLLSKIDYNYINGFGYGTGIFYPQLNIFLSSLIYLVLHNVSISLKIYIYINTLLSSLVMYFFLKDKIHNKNSALIGSLLYILAPYTYVQSMFKCAIGELSVFLSLPLLFWGIERVFENKRYGNLLIILGGIYVLQSHMISTVFTLLFICLYLILNYKKLFNKKVMLNLFISCFVIVLLSLYFLIPLIEHYIISDYNMLIASNSPYMRVVYFTQLFFSNGNFGGNVDGYSISNEMPYTISFLIIVIVMTLPYIYNRLNDKVKNEIAKLLIISLLIIIMMCCPGVWGHIKYLDIIQFPWRLLSYCIFFLSIVATLIFNEYKISLKNFTIALYLVIILSFIQLNNYIVNTPIASQPSFDLNKELSNQIVDDPENINLHTAMGAKNDYLPTESDIKYIATRGSELITIKGNLNVNHYTFQNGKISADIEVEGNTKIELPLIYYLGYNITLDGNKIDYVKNKNGFIQINLKDVSGNLKVKYTGTKLDILASFVTIFSFIIFVCYYIYNIFFKKRKILCRK